MEVTHLGCVTVHQLVIGYLLVNSKVDPIPHVARSIDRLSPKPSRSPMLVEHRPSHLAQGPIFPFHHASREGIRTRKLVFKTQVMAKGFEERVFEFRDIVTVDRSYGISPTIVTMKPHRLRFRSGIGLLNWFLLT
jgi:hypothetical protein